MKAWHFLPADRRLRYDDNRIVEVGETYSATDRDPELRVYGMHASLTAMGALQRAPGPVVCRVDLWGDVVRGDDEIVGAHRKVLAMADATEALWQFARLCALDVIDLWDAPGVVVRYLTTGDESIRDAAWNAPRAAAWAAAWNATRAATRAAAWNATRAAAWNAARDAARAAAGNVAESAAWDAAWAAAWNTGRNAVSKKQSRRLSAMLSALLRGRSMDYERAEDIEGVGVTAS